MSWVTVPRYLVSKISFVVQKLRAVDREQTHTHTHTHTDRGPYAINDIDDGATSALR